MNISNHAKKRLKQRLGLPKRALIKHVDEALDNGKVHSFFAGSFKRYLDGVFLRERSASNIKVYKGNLYLFTHDALITVYPVPKRYRSIAR